MFHRGISSFKEGSGVAMGQASLKFRLEEMREEEGCVYLAASLA